MIDFYKELSKYKPILELDEVEDDILSDDLEDIIDILKNISKENKQDKGDKQDEKICE